LLGEEGLDVKESDIPASVKVRLNTKVCRSQSWLIKLARILLILSSEAC